MGGNHETCVQTWAWELGGIFITGHAIRATKIHTGHLLFDLMFCFLFSSAVLTSEMGLVEHEHLGCNEDALTSWLLFWCGLLFSLSMFPLLLLFFFLFAHLGLLTRLMLGFFPLLRFPCYLNPGLAATPLTTDERYDTKLAIGTMILWT